MIFRNLSNVIGKRFPARMCYKESIYILIRIVENKEYLNGKWGENTVGFTYECVETKDFQHLKIKIDGQKEPLMTNEKLQELRGAGEQVFVEFDNETIMPYISRPNDETVVIADSMKADGVRIVNEDEEQEIDL